MNWIPRIIYKFSQLLDTMLSGLQDGDIPRYDSASGKWKNTSDLTDHLADHDYLPLLGGTLQPVSDLDPVLLQFKTYGGQTFGMITTLGYASFDTGIVTKGRFIAEDDSPDPDQVVWEIDRSEFGSGRWKTSNGIRQWISEPGDLGVFEIGYDDAGTFTPGFAVTPMGDVSARDIQAIDIASATADISSAHVDALDAGSFTITRPSNEPPLNTVFMVRLEDGVGGHVPLFQVQAYGGIILGIPAAPAMTVSAGGNLLAQGTIQSVAAPLATAAQLSTHTGNTSNPHGVTANQVLPAQATHANKVLKTDGNNPYWGTGGAAVVAGESHAVLDDLDYASSGHTGFAASVHNHDGVYSLAAHTHDGVYSLAGHTHAAAIAGGSDGFMTGADKTKLDGIASGAQPGTVTGITLAVPSFMTGGGTINTSGTFTLAFASQTARYAFVAPTTNGVPTFRQLTNADISGLGTMATQASNSVSISGGTVNATTLQQGGVGVSLSTHNHNATYATIASVNAKLDASVVDPANFSTSDIAYWDGSVLRGTTLGGSNSIDDLSTGTGTTWSSQKISDELGYKASSDHSHDYASSDHSHSYAYVNDSDTNSSDTWSSQKISDQISSSVSGIVVMPDAYLHDGQSLISDGYAWQYFTPAAIDDGNTGSGATWSSQKISDELGGKSASDHSHAAAIAAGAAGFMTGADKTKLDGIETGAQPGTVTGITLAVPAFMTGGGTINTSGTFTLAYSGQTAKYVLAAPNGSAGVPTFRQLGNTDITGLGTMSTQNSNAVSISAGTVNATTLQQGGVAVSLSTHNHAGVYSLAGHDHAGTYATAGDLAAHTGNTSNPHSVTAAQLLPDWTGQEEQFLKVNGSGVLQWSYPSYDHNHDGVYATSDHSHSYAAINDGDTSTSDTWSSQKISDELGGKSASGHTHTGMVAIHPDEISLLDDGHMPYYVTGYGWSLAPASGFVSSGAFEDMVGEFTNHYESTTAHGMGTMAAQNANAVNITGGTILINNNGVTPTDAVWSVHDGVGGTVLSVLANGTLMAQNHVEVPGFESYPDSGNVTTGIKFRARPIMVDGPIVQWRMRGNNSGNCSVKVSKIGTNGSTVTELFTATMTGAQVASGTVDHDLAAGEWLQFEVTGTPTVTGVSFGLMQRRGA